MGQCFLKFKETKSIGPMIVIDSFHCQVKVGNSAGRILLGRPIWVFELNILRESEKGTVRTGFRTQSSIPFSPASGLEWTLLPDHRRLHPPPSHCSSGLFKLSHF